MPRVKESFGLPSRPTPMSPVATPRDFALVAVEHFGRREAGIDFDAEFFRLGREQAADIAERADEIAVIVHQRRHQEIGQAKAARWAEKIEMVVRHLHFQRAGRVLAPAGQELVEADRIDHRAGQDMGADFGPLFDEDDGQPGIDLLEPDRRCESRRPSADDHNVVIHRLARLQFDFAHLCLPNRGRTCADRQNL